MLLSNLHFFPPPVHSCLWVILLFLSLTLFSPSIVTDVENDFRCQSKRVSETQLWTQNGSLRQGAGEDVSCALTHPSAAAGTTSLPCRAIRFPIPQSSHANRHLTVVMGRREGGKMQAAQYSNSEGPCLRTPAQVCFRQRCQMLQGWDGQEIWPQESLKKTLGWRRVSEASYEESLIWSKIGGMKMGRRLVKVYKVITHLLISDTAFPWNLLGILRLHTAVCPWSRELTSCMLSGWKLSAEPSPQAGPKHASSPSPSWAALLQNPICAGELPPMYRRTLLAQRGWVFVFVFFFCYSDADCFTRNVRKLIYPSRHIQFRGKGQLVMS